MTAQLDASEMEKKKIERKWKEKNEQIKVYAQDMKSRFERLETANRQLDEDVKQFRDAADQSEKLVVDLKNSVDRWKTRYEELRADCDKRNTILEEQNKEIETLEKRYGDLADELRNSREARGNRRLEDKLRSIGAELE